MSPTALITGITGQDGFYLAQLLLDKGYRVVGMVRKDTTPKEKQKRDLFNRIEFIQGDLTRQDTLNKAIQRIAPDEVYNLAAQSYVPRSWEDPTETGDITGLGVARLLEAVRNHNPNVRFCQASSSEMFGAPSISPQNEQTPFQPRSPYGAAKVYAHCLTVNYRQRHQMFCCSAILYNHESPFRGVHFVTRKITEGVARIKAGALDRLLLGDLESRRDWGYAADFMEALWLMLQAQTPEDYVIATGETHTVREIVEIAFSVANLDWKDYVEIDPRFLRPKEDILLVGDTSKARKELGWKPRASFVELITKMTQEDLKRHNAL